MATKTCFLICPIGDDGSDIRRNADDLMDLIVVPALEKFDFEVVRADKIPRPSVITTDIIQLVQNSELCIIDLTGSNPNVFYECGRRHETGKPFIQLINKGERLPFDVSGIRTIPYDLSSVRTAHTTIKEIQNYVSELSMSDFSARTSGESLSSLASAVQRIERKLNSYTIVAGRQERETEEAEYLERIRIEANPRRAFREAYDAGELLKARKILPILHTKLGNVGYVLSAASVFTEAGDTAAADLCLEILGSPSEPLSVDILRRGIASLVNYYDLVDGEKDGVKILEPIVQANAKRDDIDNLTKASILNQLQKLFFAIGQYESSLAVAEQVVELDATRSGFLFNLGLNYNEVGMKAKAADAMDTCLKIAEPKDLDWDDLSRIVVIFKKAERINEAKSVLAKMDSIDPRRTRTFINEDEELKALMAT
jgi:tetratricopeptide (TPR) repeat protein